MPRFFLCIKVIYTPPLGKRETLLSHSGDFFVPSICRFILTLQWDREGQHPLLGARYITEALRGMAPKALGSEDNRYLGFSVGCVSLPLLPVLSIDLRITSSI